ncbi:MAG: hypothetical protein ABL952_07195, partial [Pyrinomonadaceae bacterium]
MPTRSIRFVVSLLLTMLLAVTAFADTVRLKDGSIIKGKIMSFDGGKFVVVIGEGSRRRELTFMASEIESIQFDSPSMNPQNTTTPRTASYKDPVTSPPVKVVTTDSTAPQTRPDNSGGKLKPIGWTVKVLADNTSNGWTNSGWVVKKGQRIRISGDGKISLGKGQTTTPSGSYTLEDNQKLLKNVATGALLAVIGDDNNDFIYVGAEREFVATRDGALFLGINEGNLDDNSG